MTLPAWVKPTSPRFLPLGTRADPSRPWQRAQFSAKLASKPPFSEKLKQEIRLARQITRRYALRTHYFGECDGIPYMSMEYLKGLTLRSLLDGGAPAAAAGAAAPGRWRKGWRRPMRWAWSTRISSP